MLPTGGYGGGGTFGGLSFRDDPRGYRKKSSWTKQLSKLFPIVCGLLAVGLTIGVVFQNSNIQHWKGEHKKLQGSYDRRGEETQRLQRLLNTERDSTRKQSQELSKLQGSKSNLEAEARVASDQRRQLQESATQHQSKVDELVASLNAAEQRRTQQEDTCRRQHETDARRLQSLQLISDNHQRLWADLDRRLKDLTAHHELKESEWNAAKADMDAQLAQDRAAGQANWGGADAAGVVRDLYQPSPVPVVDATHAAHTQKGFSLPQQDTAAQQQQQQGQHASDSLLIEAHALQTLLDVMGVEADPGVTEAIITEFLVTQRAEEVHPGLEPPHGNSAQKLGDLLRSRGIKTDVPSHEILVLALGHYFKQHHAETGAMVGRAELSPPVQTGTHQAAPGDSTQAADPSHTTGRKEMHEKQSPEVLASGQQAAPVDTTGTQDAAATDGQKDPATAAKDRWHAFRRANDDRRVKPDAAGFVA